MYLEIKNIKKSYGENGSYIEVIKGISASIEKGQICAILGPSGSGKSTFLNLIGGLDELDFGSIKVDNKELFGLNQNELSEYRRENLGFVFQFYNLIQNLTAKENVEIASQICKEPMDAEEALRSVGLEDRMDNFPSQLSGGEQQRVAIARALAKRPKLLLCDEPTGALDYQTGKNILKLLQETCRKENMTVVLVTHNQAITPMADRVIRVKNSKVESMVINKKLTSIDDIEW